MIQIRREAEEVVTGKQPRDNNVLSNAPHPISVVTLPEEEWKRYACAPPVIQICRLLTSLQQALLTPNSGISYALAIRAKILAHRFQNRRWCALSYLPAYKSLTRICFAAFGDLNLIVSYCYLTLSTRTSLRAFFSVIALQWKRPRTWIYRHFRRTVSLYHLISSC